MWFIMVVMLNYLKGIPISYLTRIMGFLPVIGFPFELLHRSVPSQVFSYAPYPSFVIALDGDPNLWFSDVHLCCNGCNVSSSSIISWTLMWRGILMSCLLLDWHNLPRMTASSASMLRRDFLSSSFEIFTITRRWWCDLNILHCLRLVAWRVSCLFLSDIAQSYISK